MQIEKTLYAAVKKMLNLRESYEEMKSFYFHWLNFHVLTMNSSDVYIVGMKIDAFIELRKNDISHSFLFRKFLNEIYGFYFEIGEIKDEEDFYPNEDRLFIVKFTEKITYGFTRRH